MRTCFEIKLRYDDFCFACGRNMKAGSVAYIVDTRDAQYPYVGPDCYKKIEKAGDAGFQPKGHGPKLWLAKSSVPA